MDNRMFCYRPNGTCYAILTPAEWERLRKAGRLDAELARRRASGEVLEVARNDGATYTPAKHFKPREATQVMVALAWAPGLSYPGGDPENGPARRVPVDGCVTCGSMDADSYNEHGVCNGCSGVQHECTCAPGTDLEPDPACPLHGDAVGCPECGGEGYHLNGCTHA